MKKSLLEKRKRIWHRFEKWEAQRSTSQSNQLQLVGEWVDFFLLRHPRTPDSPRVHGIQKMHRCLSHISISK